MVQNLLLSGSRQLLLDTNAFIYFLNGQEPHYSTLLPVFRRVQQGQASIVASVITESELLVKPERDANRDAIERITDLLSEDGIFVIDVNHRIARRAAALRGAAFREADRQPPAKSAFRLPDAIIVATAIETGCDAIVTNDGGWPKVFDLPVVNLGEVSRAG